jgi:hypothetical protein
LLAYQSRLDFWKAQLERADTSGLLVQGSVAGRFVAYYERKIASVMAKQDLHVPESDGG